MKDRSMVCAVSAKAWLACVASLFFLSFACSGGSSSADKRDAGLRDGGVDAAGAGGGPALGGTSGAGGVGSGGIRGSGGKPGSGGTSGSGGMGAGGATGLDGATGLGGATGLDGAIGLGGATGTGGATGLDGATALDGATGTGGATGLGGATARGGATGTGGIASGGKPGSGGVTGTGGIGSGGTPASGGAGGTTSLGGTTGLGGATGTGGLATGGAPGDGGATGTGGDYGFTFRSPGSHTVSCTGPLGTLTITSPDMDWLCTFDQANQTGFVYVRSTVTGANCLAMGAMPLYTIELAQISINGVVTSLAQAQYSYGDVHNNDYMTIDYQGATYKYYHSSLGYGNRKCQPMDCIDIYALDSTTLQTEGCAPARALPEVCVQIKAGGTHAALVDTFAKCPGDVNP